MATIPLTGFKFSEDKAKLVEAAKKEAVKAEKDARDGEYLQRLAEEKVANLAPAAASPEACAEAAKIARAEAAAAQKTLDGPPALTGQAARPFKGTIARAEGKAKLLEDLATKKAEECAQALEEAKDEALKAKARAEELRKTATDLAADAKKLEDESKLLGKTWAKDQTANPDMRKQEADWRAMKDELDVLGVKAPPGAKAYCKALEKSIDDTAHKAACKRCAADHGIPRTDEAKDKVNKLVSDLERLARLPNDEGLTGPEKQIRAVGVYLERLRNSVVGTDPKGRMVGVLICDDGSVIMGFSGDIDGADDMPGFAKHVPPGGSFKTANNVTVPLSKLPDMQGGTPHGVCAAPKMIQEAYKTGKKPAAMAEVWYGKETAQPHGALVASCKTCVANLDVQLCDRYPTT